MGTLKKLVVCLGIIAGCIGFTMSAHSTEVLSTKPTIVMIDSFNTYDLAVFIRSTCHLQNKDTLKIITVGPGGDSLICISMMNHIESLQARGVQVTTEVQGMACSANAFIWLSGDKRVVHRHDLVMFHLAYLANASGERVEYKNLNPLQRMILNHINNYIRFKLTRTINSTEIVNNMLDDPDNWYTGFELMLINVATHLIEN